MHAYAAAAASAGKAHKGVRCAPKRKKIDMQYRRFSAQLAFPVFTEIKFALHFYCLLVWYDFLSEGAGSSAIFIRDRPVQRNAWVSPVGGGVGSGAMP